MLTPAIALGDELVEALRAQTFTLEVARLEALGARPTGTPFDECGCRWQVMADLEDNEFCVCEDEE